MSDRSAGRVVLTPKPPLPLGEGRGEGCPPGESSSIRVTIPLAGFNLSGGVKSLVGVANALAQRGHRVRFLVPDYAASPPAELDPAVRVRVLGSGPSWLPRPARKALHLARLATNATARSDLCLANYFTTAYAAWISSLVHRNRAVLAYNVRGYEPLSHGWLAPASLPSRLVRLALAWLSYRLPLHKICTTEWLRERVGDPNAWVAGHGIDLATFRPPPPRRSASTITVGTIGRLGDVKGYPDFLRAVDELTPDLPISINLAAPDRVEPAERFSAHVSHPMTEPEMAEFYGQCDVFVFSSRAEGFGLPALEAMACGCAVITTDCGGVNHFAQPGKNCLMVPPVDPTALANAITTVARDEELRATLIRGGLDTARQFDRERMLDRFCRHLEKLARDR